MGTPSEAPDSDRDSRPETDRRDDDDRDDDRDDRSEPPEPPERPEPADAGPDPPDPPARPEPADPDEPAAPRPGCVTPVGGEPSTPPGATTGARPHVSQYSSPPPTSSYVPAQSGR
ncbi:hypothetical protein [Streptomyces mashuensis]|uniref:hypothetical protein n=1 Tax=Streptomyces mashuensis TaxID=33904 RepID=UPI0040328F27